MKTSSAQKKAIIFGILFLNFFYVRSQNPENPGLTENPKQNSIMLLGVYHFNNPGMDTYNMEIDDYTSNKRQKEIKEVVRLLEAYKPTKILVEFSKEDQLQLDSLYTLYLENKTALKDIDNGINEVFQIGFRLGKQLNGVKISAIDHPGNWLAPYADFIADTLELEYYQKYKLSEAANIEERNTTFLANSIKENLIYLNKWEQILQNHTYYNNVAIRVKDTANIAFSYQQVTEKIDGLPYLLRSFDFNNIGVELVAEWYKRNLFIYRNIVENTKENERVLVIIGSGHVFYLNQLLTVNSAYDIVNVSEFLNP